MTAMAAELIDVSVIYTGPGGQEITALSNINFACKGGTSTSIVGRSGSGKSTLISVVSLLRTPTSGRVVVQGIDSTELTQRRRAAVRAEQVGVVFQSFHLEPSLTVVDNVMLGWHFNAQGLSRQEAASRVASDLDMLGIADLGGRRPNALSGGQRQRVAVARAIFPRPALLVADEPTGNLDEATAGAVAESLMALPRIYGAAVVVVTHDRAVAQMAEVHLELSQGRICDARV